MEAEFGEPHPDRVRLDPDAVERRVGVRRHVGDRAARVEGEHAVTDARRCAGIGHASGERERAGLDHLDELFEDEGVVAFELAERPARTDLPLLREHGDDAVSVPHRDREHPGVVDLVAASVNLDRALDSLAEAEGLLDQFGLVAVGPGPDVVGDVHRLVGGGAHLVDDQPLAGVGSHVQQQVGEAEVGEERPLGSQPVQVVDVVAVER